MKSLDVEYGLEVAHLVARNLIRNHGEADGDTISEWTRGKVVSAGRLGPLVFTAGLFAAAEVFRRHIIGRLERECFGLLLAEDCPE